MIPDNTLPGKPKLIGLATLLFVKTEYRENSYGELTKRSETPRTPQQQHGDVVYIQNP